MILGCFVSRVGVRADPGKVKAIAAWPTPQKDPQNAGYAELARPGYAEFTRPLSDLLKKDADWVMEQQHQDAFDSIKASLQGMSALDLPVENKAFSIVCDASDYAIGCALLQKDDEGRERLKAAERNYPVHDKELLAMKYALVKFRVHLLDTRPFVIYTDHASLWTATNSPHLSQRMARWLSFFAEHNFRVEYKPGKLNVLADALSRRPDYKLAHISRVTTDLYDRIRLEYQADENYASLVQFLSDGKDAKVDRLSPRQRAQLHRYELADGLLHFRVDPGDSPRAVVPNDEDPKYDILLEAHDAPMSGHLGREKTYQMASPTFWWSHMYKVKPSGQDSAPLRSLPVPTDSWKAMSLDFYFGFPVGDKRNTGILVIACRLSKMAHLAPLFLNSVFRCHGLSETIVSDQGSRFTGAFWDTVFQLLGTKLTMSTADHPQTDGQTERVNRVLEDTLRSICAEAPRSWSDQLPMVEFTLNNAVHASTGFTPFYLNGLRHPQVLLTLRGGTVASIVSAGEARKAFSSQVSEIEPESLKRQMSSFIDDRLTLISRVKDAMAQAQDKQKEYADKKTLKPTAKASNKLKHRFIGPFAVLARHGVAYTIDLPKSMATHPTFYVGRLKRYHDPLGPPSRMEGGQDENTPPRNEAESSGQPELPVSESVNDTEAGTHARHTKDMRVPNEKSSRKSHTHKPSRMNTREAHIRGHPTMQLMA
ncbi:Pol protein [Phytophthora palmivora]|uniref:Pol protein n=1 Tax=Phytophthora palmivora TaxID=4796 RepID=A0A2P4X025_9STRA|nr:Pol protein [Phytophthora palmivora]